MNGTGIEHEQIQLLGPGARLRMTRESMGLSRRDAAMGLRLKETVIADIESDVYDNMPGFVFLRGYLRAYAKLLHISADEIIAAFNGLALTEQPEGKSMPLIGKPSPSYGRLLHWGAYCLLLGLFVSGGYWWRAQHAVSDMSVTGTISEAAKRLSTHVTAWLPQGEK